MLNAYGDKATFISPGQGADIASQRADDLDNLCLDFLKTLGESAVAVDVACGAGGQAVRMGEIGATVLAIDHVDMSSVIAQAASQYQMKGSITFFQADMRAIEALIPPGSVHAVICQRAIHYLPFAEAIKAVAAMRNLIAPGGRIFISASGMLSELGEGYAGRDEDKYTRYVELAPAMRDKHGIHGPVCLYSQEDMADLLSLGGFQVENLFSSAFGNIKAVGDVIK